jgi:hypothetical protein
MPSPFVDAGLLACLESIRDVAADMSREIDRADNSDNWSSVRAMVQHIQHKTNTALKLIDPPQRPHK